MPTGRCGGHVIEKYLAVAACAVPHPAALWTLNRADFADIVGLSLVD
jgi:hypothetical protein